MRLTLRTLLAYLDDILEPLEIKAIGQKVAESETAQELIARIKQVTRRRRITTPPATGPNSFEPNLVAEYLDNELSPEQVAEVEKICLESDVHLAEVASCHQILTLVLGEPAVVPPTAKERMYALVQGREAIPFRKAAAGAHASAPTSADADADEMFLLGLPFYRRGSWLRWALPLAAVLLFTVVAVALWKSIQGVPPSTTPGPVVQTPQPNVPQTTGNPPAHPAVKGANGENKNPPAGQPETPHKPAANPPDDKQPKEPKTGGSQPELKTDKLPPTAEPGKTPDKAPAAPAAGRQAPPSKERIAVGKYATPDYPPGPSLLVQRRDKEGWGRLKSNAPLFTGDQLVSLPGYASEVRLDCGIHLLLRGHVREFSPPEVRRVMDYLQESTIVLHKPKDTDADLTLERGRLYLSNHKGKDTGALVVRLRFEDKVWDLTLQPEAEVVVDLLKARNAGEPLSALKLTLLNGNAGLALERENYPDLTAPGWAQFFWDSTNPSIYGRQQISKQELDYAKRTLFPKSWTVNSPEAKGMELALKAVRDRMTVDQAPSVVLQDVLENTEKISQHWLALYCLAALDEVKIVLDVLGKADQIHHPDREAAIFSLRRWLDHGRGQEARLFNPETQTGILTSELLYTRSEAKRIMDLLRDPTTEQVFSKGYYEDMAKDLVSEKVAIAELARWRLYLLAVGMFHLEMPKLTAFNAARPPRERVAAMQEVLEKVSESLLPPPEPRKPGSPGGAQPPPKGGIKPEPRLKR